MNISRVWFLILGLLILVGGGGIYYFSSLHQVPAVSPASLPVASTGPVPSPSHKESPATTSEPTPAPQPQDSLPPGTSAYQYTAQGQLQQITYSDGTIYVYSYDSHGDKIRETNRHGKTWTYIYDQSQHPISVIDPKGRIMPIESSPGEGPAK